MSGESEDVKLEGILTRPAVSRKSMAGLYLHINGRPVQARNICYSIKGAYGSLLQHYTGWNSQSGYQDSEPVKGGLWADPWVGMELAMVTTACLNYRMSTGLGQYVDFSMAEALLGSMPITILNHQLNGFPSESIGNEDDLDLMSELFRCKGEDSWLALSITCEGQWNMLYELLGRKDLNVSGKVE